GLAVWAVGGHYGPEPVDEMAAALPAMQRYIPLRKLLDDFHAEQHEIAYIEAGSFVGFLIERYGLATVKRFYGNADRPADYFDGKGYGELEQEWLAWLAEHARTPRRFEWGRYADTDWLRLASATGRTPFSTQAGGGVLMPPAFDERWWQLQIRYFDAMRAYQQRFEPFARTLPAAPSDWATPLRSEYAINPAAPENLALETQLQAASQGLYCGDLDSAAARLAEVEKSAAAGRLTGAEARQRLAVTRLLASQDQALRASNGAAYVATAAASLRPHLEELRRQVDERGGAHQELSRLWLNAAGDRATAWVTWLPLPEQGGAIPISAASYRLVLTREGRQWLLTDFQPLQLTKLLPRSDHLCNPSLAASW
ncbi:MAG TPA: hypothetical protein VER55_04375, partial [Ardenticatenaceae bacterium]|nr:hypothetical protein [Ardenticatenaceae bacterium]